MHKDKNEDRELVKREVYKRKWLMNSGRKKGTFQQNQKGNKGRNAYQETTRGYKNDKGNFRDKRAKDIR